MPLHHRPLRENLWLSNIPVGQHYKYKFLGSVVTAGHRAGPYLTEKWTEMAFVKVYEAPPQLGVY